LQFVELGLKANPNLYCLINSKIVALALDGKVKEAAAFLPKLEAFEHDPEVRPFVFAARGLIAFRQGNFQFGRIMYTEAIAIANKSPRPTLAGNAAMYWLEQELIAGTIRPDDANAFLKKLDKAFASPGYGSGKSLLWIARKRNIIDLIKILSVRHEILNRFSNSEVGDSVPPILVN
jgi:hypothetical protein